MKNKEHTLFIALFILWFAITLFTGFNHEPWADEAQSWLISRDNSYLDMLCNVLRYEGHPCLWYFILHTLALTKFPYEYIFLIPISLTAIGIYLFLFKTKLPTLIKIIFPFTYFVIYQYSIIARSYSLFFPLLMAISVTYKNRTQKPILYATLLILLLSSSAYSFVIAVILFGFWLYDLYKQKVFNRKIVFSIISIITFMTATFIYLKVPTDCISYEPFTVLTLKKICYILSNGYFYLTNNNVNLYYPIFLLVFYIIAGINYCRNIKQALFFTTLNLGIVLLMSITVCRQWHYGHIIITLIFTLSVLCLENQKDNINKIVNNTFLGLFTFLAIIQIYWGYNSIKYDLFNNYSASKDIAFFIKANHFDKYEINGLGYDSVSVQPYFEHNIYKNYKTSHFMFSSDFKSNNYKIAKELTPVIIYDSSWYIGYADIIDNLKDYDIYQFDGKISNKGHIPEKSYVFVFVKKYLK